MGLGQRRGLGRADGGRGSKQCGGHRGPEALLRSLALCQEASAPSRAEPVRGGHTLELGQRAHHPWPSETQAQTQEEGAAVGDGDPVRTLPEPSHTWSSSSTARGCRTPS